MRIEAVIIAVIAGLAAGCSSCKKPGPTTGPTTGPVTQPAEEPIDGKTNYSAKEETPAGVFVVTLPHKTDAAKITRIELWLNTSQMEAHRVNNKITYDQVHLVTEDDAHTTLVQDNIFGTLLTGPGKDDDMVTTGSAVGSGDVFDLSEGRQGFEGMRREVSEGMFWVRLKSTQPNPTRGQLLSAKVKLTLNP